MVSIVDVLGTLAACLTTLSFLPQAVKVLREKNTDAISLSMYALFVTGVALWFLYGVMLVNWPIIIANAVTLLLASIILYIKILNTLKKRKSKLQS